MDVSNKKTTDEQMAVAAHRNSKLTYMFLMQTVATDSSESKPPRPEIVYIAINNDIADSWDERLH